MYLCRVIHSTLRLTMRSLFSIKLYTAIITMMLAGAATMVGCVEDRVPIFPEYPTPDDDDKENNENGSGDENGNENGGDDNGNDNGGNTQPPLNNDYPDTSWAAGELVWVFDMNVLPEIRISVTEEQWNALLKEYDRDNNTAEYIHCDAEFKSKGETHNFVDAGLRLRGNTSRRRPEGNGGEMHKRDNADWHHCHFMLNLRKYQKDDAHELHNVRKLHLKSH